MPVRSAALPVAGAVAGGTTAAAARMAAGLGMPTSPLLTQPLPSSCKATCYQCASVICSCCWRRRSIAETTGRMSTTKGNVPTCSAPGAAAPSCTAPAPAAVRPRVPTASASARQSARSIRTGAHTFPEPFHILLAPMRSDCQKDDLQVLVDLYMRRLGNHIPGGRRRCPAAGIARRRPRGWAAAPPPAQPTVPVAAVRVSLLDLRHSVCLTTMVTGSAGCGWPLSFSLHA